MSERDQCLPQQELKITPAMIETGVLEAREHPLGAPVSDLVRKVFIAMSVEASSR